MNKNIDAALLVLRVSVGGLMLFHGIAKLIHGIGFLVDNLGLGAFAYGVYIGEIVAPLMLLLGFRTRIASILLAGTCLVAIFTAHSHEIFSISAHGGYALELLMLYLFGAIALFLSGGGKYAVSTNNQWD